MRQWFRKWCSGGEASSSKGGDAARKPFHEEEREGFVGRVGFDLRGASVTFLPSNPEIRGKWLNFLGNCGISVAENLEVILSSPSQPPVSSFPSSSGLALPFLSPSAPVFPSSVIQPPVHMENRVISDFFSKTDDGGTLCQNGVGIPNLVVVESQSSCSNQLLESLNLIKSKPNVPSEVSNLVTVSQGNVVDSPLGEFQIEGLSPRKMAKVCEVLSSLDIKVYSRRKSRCSTGL